MIEVRLDTSDFASWLDRASARLQSGSRQALGQSVALALQHARETTLFKDQSGALRRSIVRGGRGTWNHFIKATAKHAAYVEYGTRPHTIEARRARALRFVQAGKVRFARSVRHPGTKPTHFMQRARDFGERTLLSMLERATAHAFH